MGISVGFQQAPYNSIGSSVGWERCAAPEPRRHTPYWFFKMVGRFNGYFSRFSKGSLQFNREFSGVGEVCRT
jgi:hypothetical protein